MKWSFFFRLRKFQMLRSKRRSKCLGHRINFSTKRFQLSDVLVIYPNTDNALRIFITLGLKVVSCELRWSGIAS